MVGDEQVGEQERTSGGAPAPGPGAAAPPRTGFFDELRRRQVHKAAVAYVIASVGVMQASEAVTRILELPRWVPTAVLVPVAIGFLVNLWVAWHFDIGTSRRAEGSGAGAAEPWAPKRRLVLRKPTWAVVGIMAAVVVALAAWRYLAVQATPPRTQTVLIADFDNQTGEPVFDGTLEPALGIAMEGASFITSYSRAAAQKVADRMKLSGAGLGEERARLVAQREGIAVVTSGSIRRDGGAYRVAVRAVDAFTGKRIAEKAEEVSGKEQVLGAVTKLAARVRSALGDETPQGVQRREGETYSATSIEAAHEYARGASLALEGRYDEAQKAYLEALRLDPGMGRAFVGLAVIENNRGHHGEAERYFREAMARVDRMSEREKHRSRGAYYLRLHDPDKAIEALGALVAQFPADNAGLANLAVAYQLKRDFPRALAEARRAVAIYPRNVPQRNNVGLFAMYAGDFEAAIQEQKAVVELNPAFVQGYVGLALAQLAAGRRDDAEATWKRLEGLGPEGASAAAEGLADLAAFEGRLAEARTILEKATAADRTRRDADAASRKLAQLASVYLAQGQASRALAVAGEALQAEATDFVAFGAASAYAAAGEEKRALAVAEDLQKRLGAEARMYAELVRGEVELRRRSYAEAVARFRAAGGRVDSWLARCGLGRAYLEAGELPAAQDELEKCQRRRGEATDASLDVVPTYRLYSRVEYDLGRALEGLESPAAADHYRAFLALKKGDEDPLVGDARRRLGGR